MGLKIFIDGVLYDREDAKISVYDHGFLYGDGVFEGIRVYNGRIFRLSEHLDRLYESAKTIMLEIPMTKEEMIRETVNTVRVNGIRNGYIRLIVSRGEGDLGLDPRKCRRPTVVIIADRIELFPQECYTKGLQVVTVPTRRNLTEAISPRVKSLNYLNNILARIEGNLAGYPEVIMLNSEGYVVEGSGDNVFIVKKGVLKTPPLYMGILEGITRNVVIELARGKGIPVEEVPMSRHDLYNADECFLTGTAAELVPVTGVDGRTIGEGVPGEITRLLSSAFRDLTGVEGFPVYAEDAEEIIGPRAQPGNP